MEYNRAVILLMFISLMAPLGSGLATETNHINPFVSDGCSLFPDGTHTQPTLWLHCCVAHDQDYWQGGIKAQRYQSDNRLAACVSNASSPVLGQIMYFGVRFGGSASLKTPFRWGFGWQVNRGYQALTQEQLNQISVITKPLTK